MSDSDTLVGSSGMLRMAKLLGFLLAAIMIVAFIFGVVVRPGEMGVRQILVGPKQGFSKVALAPGYHWNIPVIYSKIHHIPEELQLLHMDRNTRLHPESEGALEVQTTDGSSVIVDVSIVARYYQSAGSEGELKHGGPADLIQKLGARPDQWRNTLRKVSIDELRRALGRLSTSEFYDPVKREAQSVDARTNMNKALAEFGIQVVEVLVRRYTYGEERIDRAIFEKNLQDQEERLNGAASRLAEARAKSEQVSAEMDAKISTLTIQGENTARVLRSEAERFENEKRAQGDLLVAKARAESDALRSAALAQGEGAAVVVAREMIPLVGSLQGGVVSGLDPYDVDSWLKRFGVNER